MLPFLAALAPFAPIIGGAIGAIGSLMAPKPKPQTQTVTNSIDLKKLRADADAAGFNPLTIIRGGGLAGYGTSSQVMSAAPDLRFSNALSAFGSGVAQWDPYGVLEKQASIKVAEAQIANWSKQGAPSNMSFRTPSSSGVEQPSPQTFHTPGGKWVTGPWTPATDIADMYGEWIGDMSGATNYVNDVYDKSWFGARRGQPQTVSWDETGWKRDPKGTRSHIMTGGGF